MEGSINFSTSRNRIFIAILLGLILALGFNYCYKYYEISYYYMGTVVTAITMIVVGIIVKIEMQGRPAGLMNVFIILICAAFVFTGFQVLQNTWLVNEAMVVFLNMAIVTVGLLLLYPIIGRLRISLLVGGTLMFILGVVSYYVLEFRGEILVPADFLGSSTAFSVSKNYQYEWSGPLTLGLLQYIAFVVWAMKVKTKAEFQKVRVQTRSVTALMLCVFCFAYVQGSPEEYYEGWDNSYNGFAFNFAMNGKLMHVKTPSGYDVAKIEDYIKNQSSVVVANADEDGGIPMGAAEGESLPQQPNIIAIMNESFTDFSVVGDFATNKAVTPFFDALRKDNNTISGYIDVSVYGGGTCDSEYSFLTGNSTAFLPENARPYQLYINEDVPSIPSNLKEQGYRTAAIHPNGGSAWNRNVAYEYLGFDEFYDASTFVAPKTTRGALVSDEATYEKIIEIYENKGNDPLFAFDVTIQNHGGYEMDASDLEEITIKGAEGEYPMTEQFLALTNNSDTALKKLVEYFEKQGEPTIIIMFGDHQPKVEEEFYEMLYGKSLEELTDLERENMYKTPFVIWANYDLEDEYYESIGINNLGKVFLDQTGVEQAEYFDYLGNLAEEIPVITRNGIIDKDGNHYSLGEESPYQEDVKNYEYILYNNIFDNANRKNNLFYVNSSLTDAKMQLSQLID